MPFAHCIDCGSSALIDPSGRCPEGHEVGAAGARVAAAIGSSGPHPDEPKPWVGVVDLDPSVIDTADPEPRVARPPSVPATGQATPAVSAPAATDDLLRELHALGDLGDLGDLDSAPAPVTPRSTPPVAPTASPAPAPAPVAPAPASPPVPIPPPAAIAVTPGSPAPPSSPEEATDLDELASLAAAIGSLDDREALTIAQPSPTPSPAPVATPTPAAEPNALDELWAAAETAAPAATTPPFTPPAPATASPAAASVPSPSAAPAAVPTPTPTYAPAVTAEVPVAPEPAAAPEAAAPAPLSPFDGSFTARGDGVGRRTQRRLDAKATKKGLFRR